MGMARECVERGGREGMVSVRTIVRESWAKEEIEEKGERLRVRK